MRNLAERLTAIAGSVLFCISLPAFGQVASVTFTGGYTTTWGNSSGDFGAGIYSATINGTTSLSGIICDDFKDEIVTGENWNAYTVRVSTLTPSNIGNTIFGNTVGLNGYVEVAALVSMMFDGSSTYVSGSNSISGVTQAEISSAIWDITSGDTLTGLDANAQTLVEYVQLQYGSDTSSQAEASLSQDTNLWILVPTPQGTGEAQEMWTSVQDASPEFTPLFSNVPEGGNALMYVLLAGASCFGAVYFNSRSRLGSGKAA